MQIVVSMSDVMSAFELLAMWEAWDVCFSGYEWVAAVLRFQSHWSHNMLKM